MPHPSRAPAPVLVLSLAIAAAAAAFAPPPAAAAPVCPDPATCAARCDGGDGEVAACTAYAEALLRGRGVEPDRKLALRLFTKACGIDDEGPDGSIDPAACLALGDLRRDGWLFDVDRTETSRAAYQRASSRARCTEAEPGGCAVRAKAQIALAGVGSSADASWQAQMKAAAVEAERGCTKGRDPRACQVVRDLAFRVGDAAENQRLRGVAGAGFLAACTQDDSVEACTKVDDFNQRATVDAVLTRACDRGDVTACAPLRYAAVVSAQRDPVKVKPAVQALLATCDGAGHDQCAALATDLIVGRPHLGLDADPARGLALAERRCALGDTQGCVVVANTRGERGPEALRDAAKARTAADRSCRLASYNQFCQCDDPTVPGCIVRATFTDHLACNRDEVGACVRVAGRFRAGDGVDQDVTRAAGYLRRGCDAADKAACATLGEVCQEHPELPVEVCQEALIQSDLFFEAEFQAASGGDVDLIDPDAATPAKPVPTPGAITLADVASALPTSARRGKLDADLVVDVVLDRARQAAIKLVVDELVRAQRRAGYLYLKDLLDQGSRLLADPTTLRREKFEDLGMTVVRAFVAANLVDGLYPNTDALRAAPEIGPTVTTGADAFGAPAGSPLPEELHGHLVDAAYYWLGQTRLFGRAGGQAAPTPRCPWPHEPGTTLCTQLAERATAERAIGVAKVLDAVRLVKLLRGGGFEDVRRLIEAASRSRTIANMATTPGLSLASWQDQLVAGSRERVGGLRNGLTDLRTLMRASVYSERGLGLDELFAAAGRARTTVGPAAIRLTIGADQIEHIYRILRIIEAAKRDVTGSGIGPPPPPGATPPPTGAPTGALDPRALALAKIRREVMDGLQTWGPRNVLETDEKLQRLGASLDGLEASLDRLEAAIANVRAVFARFPGPDRKISLDVGDLPLYASVDLTRELRVAAVALAEVDDNLRAALPGEVPARLRFARTSTARLIAFLDLMQRVARQSPLTMRTGDVIGALRTLGTTRVSGFDAPLYDVLEPVLDAIKTHEPMSLELLFAVIGRVRLDTLIGSLQGRRSACTSDTSVDCWTTKLIHALQESVERDGNSIRVDGGKFAQRLAQHGDDFRRKHTWRGYFHLTVGVGGLYSDPAFDADRVRRPTPLIAEQVGFGLASPSILGDRMTFKIGAAASGILYRALLDSEESKAIMLHPVFLALDLGDLVELYVSPAMVMLYPPDGDQEGAVRWGASAGLSVPLSAYLERL